MKAGWDSSQCSELEGRESSSGLLVDGWPEGSRVQRPGGKQEAFSVHLATHTGAFYKGTANQPAHIWCFSQFLQWCRHCRHEWGVGRGREEHDQRCLVSLLSPAASSGSTAHKHQLQTALSVAGLSQRGLWEPGQGSSWPQTLHCIHKNWWAVGRAAGRKDNMRSLICLQEWWKARGSVRNLVFCSWCSCAAVGISPPSAKLTPPPPSSVSQEHGSLSVHSNK